MKRIITLRAIFLSLFIMVILQSCEKETFHATENQNEVTESDKSLEKEGGWLFGEPKAELNIEPLTINFSGGSINRTQYYTDITLKMGYDFTDFFVVHSDKELSWDKIYDNSEHMLYRIPINLNEGVKGKYTYLCFKVSRKMYGNGASYIDLYEYRYPTTPPYWSADYKGIGSLRYDGSYPNYHSFDSKGSNMNRGSLMNSWYLYMMVSYRTSAPPMYSIRITYTPEMGSGMIIQDRGGYQSQYKNFNFFSNSPITVLLGYKTEDQREGV